MKYLTINMAALFVFIALTSSRVAWSETPDRQNLRSTLRIVHSLGAIALDEHGSEPETRAAIERCLAGVNRPAVLARVAVVSWSLCTADVQGSDCLYAAFWVCVERLSRMYDEEAVVAMQHVVRNAPQDAGGAHRLKELVEYQEAGVAKLGSGGPSPK